MSARLKGTPFQRLMPRVELRGDCLIWTGATDKHGYGYISGGKRGLMLQTHRVAYLELRGEIPAGLELDHTCETPSCCAPWHLEPVTHGENLRRIRLRRGRCPQGHRYSDRLDSRGHLRCLGCARISNALGRARKAA